MHNTLHMQVLLLTYATVSLRMFFTLLAITRALETLQTVYVLQSSQMKTMRISTVELSCLICFKYLPFLHVYTYPSSSPS